MMIITYSDSLFPDEFRKIPDCPEVLYALGNTDLLTTGRKAAVIGARKADEAGIDAAYRLGYMYAEQGYTVVSGLAFGCDAAAHRGSLPASAGKAAAPVPGKLSCHCRSYAYLRICQHSGSLHPSG